MSSSPVETRTKPASNRSTLYTAERPSHRGKNPLGLRSRSIRMSSRISPSTILAVLTLGGFFFIHYSFRIASSRSPQLRGGLYSGSYRSSSGDLVTPPLVPNVSVINDVELFFMVPKTGAKGVLIFFHGCHHSGQDMFELPEDRIVALAALNRGLAVLSPSSSNRSSGCWSHNDLDMLDKNKVIDKWMALAGLAPDLPRMGMGASSGGSFLFSVYDKINLKSIASYVSGKGFPASTVTEGKAIPTAFVHMPKDFKTADKVEEKYKALGKAGVPTKRFDVHPHALTVELCARRLPEFGDRRCRAFIHDAIKSNNNLLDKDEMSVLTTYQSGDWNDVMNKAKFDASLKSDDSQKKPGALYAKNFGGHSWLWASMEEEIAVSWAVHEMTAEYRQEVLDFLMEQAGIPL